MVSGNGIAKHWIAIILVSAFVSAGTAYFVVQMFSPSLVNTTDLLSHSIQAAQLPSKSMDCDELVYSPVQNKCVTQDVFDLEMARLFTALGIDSSIYKSNTGSKYYEDLSN